MKNKEAGMTLIVKTVTRLTVGLIFIYAVYISLHGHIKPGGGFAGGLIIALSFIHIFLAFGKEATLKKISAQTILTLMGFFAVILLFILMLDFSGGPCRVSEGLRDVVISVIFGTGLFTVFLALTLAVKKEA